MARRVNTKFVIILGTVLFLGAGAVLAVVGRNMLHNRDPVYLTQLGDEALAKDDLEKGIYYYQRAADESSKSHRPGTDKLYDKLGDLSLKLSARTANPVESSQRYGQAQASWRRALTENASYVP